MAACRWEHTDAALTAQLELAAEGHPGVEPGHAAVRFTNPTTGGDASPPCGPRCTASRPGTAPPHVRETGSSVWQVFEGSGTVVLDGISTDLVRGVLIAVPSWCEMSLHARTDLDLFRFCDTPIFERLNLARKEYS